MSPCSHNRPPGTPVLVCDHVTVHYDQRSALRDASVSIYPGTTVSLLGPNGAGKSTLLKVISGMIPPSHGSVSFMGEPMNGPDQCVTYVPQRSDVDWTFPISVFDATILGLAPKRSRWSRFCDNDRVKTMDALKLVKMDHLADAQIGALSGGQQQRVFLARALLNRGTLLLLDEPFTGVDVPTQTMLVELFDDLRREGTSIVYATHDLAQAARTSDTVILLNGDLIAQGPPDDVFTEQNLTATFGGTIVTVDSLRKAATV